VIRESSPFALYWIGCCSWVFFCRSLSAPLLACGDEIINIKLKLLICIYAPEELYKWRLFEIWREIRVLVTLWQWWHPQWLWSFFRQR
jgi:hypothetical protein